MPGSRTARSPSPLLAGSLVTLLACGDPGARPTAEAYEVLDHAREDEPVVLRLRDPVRADSRNQHDPASLVRLLEPTAGWSEERRLAWWQLLHEANRTACVLLALWASDGPPDHDPELEPPFHYIEGLETQRRLRRILPRLPMVEIGGLPYFVPVLPITNPGPGSAGHPPRADLFAWVRHARPREPTVANDPLRALDEFLDGPQMKRFAREVADPEILEWTQKKLRGQAYRALGGVLEDRVRSHLGEADIELAWWMDWLWIEDEAWSVIREVADAEDVRWNPERLAFEVVLDAWDVFRQWTSTHDLEAATLAELARATCESLGYDSPADSAGPHAFVATRADGTRVRVHVSESGPSRCELSLQFRPGRPDAEITAEMVLPHEFREALGARLPASEEREE